ncbi:hypothetical protein KFL_001780010 [Klebsormidium nitens]|uniref:Uncharacterized protein n=1 Tax=Klebsormidium nitens TaxID=105231 RepID=A0A1Y1I603_KLENI|nr:hypothetical protein KFL_001780010 [Klebsormidium nitens]|eukprot:GAQ84146.1 hypothetical protein KFL_001780010 [Klebsormidium nitens]
MDSITMAAPSLLDPGTEENVNQAQKERMKKILKSQMQVLVQANRRAEKEIADLKRQVSVSRCNRLVAELKQDLAEQDQVIEVLRKELRLRGACDEEIDEALHRQLFEAERAPGASREQLKRDLKEVKVKQQTLTLQLEKERTSTARHVHSAEQAKELARLAVKHAGKARNGENVAGKRAALEAVKRLLPLEAVSEVAQQAEDVVSAVDIRRAEEENEAGTMSEKDASPQKRWTDGTILSRPVAATIRSMKRTVPLQELMSMVNSLEEMLVNPPSATHEFRTNG